MTRRRQMTVMALLGIVGLLGVAVVAVAQLNLQAALRQYEQRLAQIDKNNPNALYDLAKWSYQNGLKDEALKLAIEANAKAPDDVRPKFLVYVITHGGELTGEETGGEETPAVATISNEEVQAVLKREGAEAINGFRRVQSALISSCARTGCHTAGNPDAPFVLISLGANTEKTLVQNFLTINKYLDREKPGESRLLLKPLTGERKHPKKFSATTDPVFSSIRTWIDSLLTEADRKLPWGKKPPEEPPLPALEQK